MAARASSLGLLKRKTTKSCCRDDQLTNHSGLKLNCTDMNSDWEFQSLMGEKNNSSNKSLEKHCLCNTARYLILCYSRWSRTTYRVSHRK